MKLPADFHLSDPDRLEIFPKKGCLAIFGLPFFIAGIFMLLSGLKIIPFQNADEIVSWHYLVIFGMGLVFSSVGGGLMFGRSGYIINRSSGTIIKKIFFIFPVKKISYPLYGYNKLIFRLVPGDSDSADTYTLSLKKSSPGKDLQIYSSGFYAVAREHAIFLSKFLNYYLEDHTTNPVETLQPKNPDYSFTEKIKVNPLQHSGPLKPEPMNSHVERAPHLLRITILKPDKN
ncbi:MAG: hypothetical protein JXQ65_09150 [Candidatus Marinimicrobia bacterium]|nr:hypothetical protein [Candidatus Neomarinimicrobiota bacterium]